MLEVKSLFNVVLLEISPFQATSSVKERPESLFGDHLMEPGTSMVLTTTTGDTEEKSLFNAVLLETFQFQVIILEKER